MRPIDAYTLNNELVSWYNDTEDGKEKSILRRVMQMVVHAPTLTPLNEALTMEQLREMKDKPAYLKVFATKRMAYYQGCHRGQNHFQRVAYGLCAY